MDKVDEQSEVKEQEAIAVSQEDQIESEAPQQEEASQELPSSENQEEVSSPEDQDADTPVVSMETMEDLQAFFDSGRQADEKIKMALVFMRSAISQEGSPQFREFWQVKHRCLDFFKENLLPIVRSQLWREYIDLCNEASRLKEILNEQSDFAAEQIAQAITALEETLNGSTQGVQDEVEIPSTRYALTQTRDYYQEMQSKIASLNVCATQITALRKELMTVDIRMRNKNELFARLSACGDQVFPQRKALMAEVGEAFMKEIDSFADKHFGQKVLSEPIYTYREEIKVLQNIAKLLTLNAKAFSHVRSKLSDCWNELKEKDKEWREQKNKRRQEQDQGVEKVMERIQEVTTKLASEELDAAKALEQFEAIQKDMRNVDLSRDGVQKLRAAINEARRPLQEAEKAKDEEKKQQQKQQEEQAEQKREALFSDIDTFAEGATARTDLEALREELNTFVEQIKKGNHGQLDALNLESKLIFVETHLLKQQKEQATQDDAQALREIFYSQRELRNRLKERLEHFRRGAASSGFDIAQAMLYNDLQSAEKELLADLDAAIKALQKQIRGLEQA